jgi:hypothetical protein
MMVTDGEAGQAAAEGPETGQGIEKARQETGRARQIADSGIVTTIEIGEPEEIGEEGMGQGATTIATGKKGEAMEIVHNGEVRAFMSQQLRSSNH